MNKNIIYKKKNKVILIAEISANHNGLCSNAKKLIYSAKKNGADIVKLQTYTADTMTIDSQRNEFKIKSGLWKGSTLWDLYKKGETPLSWHKTLFDYAKKIKIPCISTPFDVASVDFLQNLKCPFYKIASTEITHEPLIKKVAQTKKPIIISTGMANLYEVENAYKIAIKNGAPEVILLYCVSNYQSKFSDFNFYNIRILKEKFKCRVGFSDHSLDNRAVISAVSAGAEFIEKHIALEKQKNGLDILFSLKGKQLKTYRNDIDAAYKMKGSSSFYVSSLERKNIKLRRSIYCTSSIQKGEKFTDQNIKIIRPANGLQPFYYEKILGKKSPISIKKYSPLKFNLLKRMKIKIIK